MILSMDTDGGGDAPVPFVEMTKISKSFPGVRANVNIDLVLGHGEVLALLGENGAGKTTLMNILCGLYRPDSGRILIEGKPVTISSPSDAAALGIGMVHQNFMLVDTMTVAENVVLGMTGLPFVPDMRRVREGIRGLSARYNLVVDPDAYVWQLSVGEQQRVEILKLLYRKARILILDEPTAVLTPQEARDLNAVIQRMKGEGKSSIFITHKMDEVTDFSDRVMVLRRGEVAAVRRTGATNPAELARLMVGRDILFHIEKKPACPAETVLELSDVTSLDDRGLPALKGISLTVCAGEILGIAGVAGNGQRELAEVITGLRRVTSGSIRVNGRDAANRSPRSIISRGVGHIPQDRISVGIVGDMSVAENLAMKGYRSPPLASAGVLRPRRIEDFARKLIELFRISTPSPDTQVKFLSGGNIQKTILAREIGACRALLVAVYPSRGLDVGATESIRKELVAQRENGTAVLLVSEDLDELISVSDTIAVMHEGRIMGTFPAASADPETLGLLMAGVATGTAGRSDGSGDSR